jgi:hypothetical protein
VSSNLTPSASDALSGELTVFGNRPGDITGRIDLLAGLFPMHRSMYPQRADGLDL